MDLAIETHGLRRLFGDFAAVDGIDLAVPAGSLYGFLGRNGAGKSTTIRCLTGLLRPSAGSLRILGLDPLSDPIAVKRLVGVMPEDLALFDRLTGHETLVFVGRVHGLPEHVVRDRAAELLSVMSLEGSAAEMVADYSHGMRKKTALAAALLPGPRLLFLDEPFEGVDAISARQIKDILHAFVGRGGTVFLTSHVLEIVERIADHVGVIHEGRLVAQASLAEIAAGAQGQNLEQIFMSLVGAEEGASASLHWLGA